MSSGRKERQPGTGRNEANEGRVGELIPGSLASLDTTLPPTPLKRLLEADGASVHVLTADSALSEVVEEAAGHQYPVIVHSEWPALLEMVEAGRCRIVLLDADRVGHDMETRVGQLHAAADSLVVLVAAPREAAQRLIGMLSERSVHRLLIKPAAVGITRLLLESAVSRYLQLREQLSDTQDDTLSTPVRKPSETVSSKLPSWIIAITLVSLLVGALAVTSVFDLGSGGDDRGAAPPSPTAARNSAGSTSPGPNEEAIAVISEPVAGDPGASTDADSDAAPDVEPSRIGAASADGLSESSAESAPAADGPPASIDGAAQAGAVAAAPPPAADAATLAAAADALRNGRLADPAGNGALELFASALAEAPGDTRARAGLDEALESAFAAAERALLDKDLDAAASMLEGIRRVQPTSGRLNFLDAQLIASRAAEAAAAASTESSADDSVPATATSPSELDSLLALARARIERGALIEPAGDSARDYLARAQAINANDADVFFVRRDLAAAVTASARLVLDAGDIERAAALVEEAFNLGADSDALALVDLDLTAARAAATARRQRASLGHAVELLSQGRLIAPADDSAEFQLLALRDENPGLEGLADAWRQLADAEAERARQALTDGDLDQAEVWVSALERSAPDSETTRSLRADLVADRRQSEYLRTPARSEELAVARAGSVSYPQDALRNEIEGSVLVEFIVDTMGRPTNIHVVEATEPGWFEEAAIESVAGYRYVPFELDGRRYERLARLRINFGLQ